jgi:hypothetical protein
VACACNAWWALISHVIYYGGNSVGIATRLRAELSGFWVRFQAGAGNFSVHHRF